MKITLEMAANISAILTPIVGVFLWWQYQWSFCRKRRRLKSYLKAEKDKAKDQGQRSLLHLMVKVGLTESEILQASFRSHHIKRLETIDPKTHLAERILFEYTETDSN